MRTVKSPPGSLRAERATVTRRRIESSARACFARTGYRATTLREIAGEADVAVQTVYAVFGSKANILRALRASVVDNPGADEAWATALAAPDVEGVLDAFARSVRLRWETGYDIVAMDAEAAHADPAIRSEVERVLGRRRGGIRQVAATLASLDARLGRVDEVAAALDAATVPEVYGVLTGAHGWTADAYEAWLRRAIGAVVRVGVA